MNSGRQLAHVTDIWMNLYTYKNNTLIITCEEERKNIYYLHFIERILIWSKKKLRNGDRIGNQYYLHVLD